MRGKSQKKTPLTSPLFPPSLLSLVPLPPLPYHRHVKPAVLIPAISYPVLSCPFPSGQAHAEYMTQSLIKKLEGDLHRTQLELARAKARASRGREDAEGQRRAIRPTDRSSPTRPRACSLKISTSASSQEELMSRESRDNMELQEAKAHISRLELALADRTTYSIIIFTGSQKGADTTAQARALARTGRGGGFAHPPGKIRSALPASSRVPNLCSTLFCPDDSWPSAPNLPPQVYLNILGVAGASGERPLLGHSQLLGSGPSFRRGSSAKFTVESHYLGHLTSMLIGHDNTGCEHSRDTAAAGGRRASRVRAALPRLEWESFTHAAARRCLPHPQGSPLSRDRDRFRARGPCFHAGAPPGGTWKKSKSATTAPRLCTTSPATGGSPRTAPTARAAPLSLLPLRPKHTNRRHVLRILTPATLPLTGARLTPSPPRRRQDGGGAARRPRPRRRRGETHGGVHGQDVHGRPPGLGARAPGRVVGEGAGGAGLLCDYLAPSSGYSAGALSLTHGYPRL